MCLLLVAAPVTAQVVTDSTATVTPRDTTVVLPRDSTVAPAVALPPVRTARAPAGDAGAPRAVRPDSARRPSPGGALRRSLLLPGWGQVYVGQPVRAPFAAAAVAGLATAAVFANTRYVHLRHAYLYVSRETADPTVPDAGNEYARFFETWQDTGSLPAATLRTQRDGARGTRDLVVLGTTVVYLLQALDAYVAAHLTEFDVSEDLSLHVAPAPEHRGVTLALRF